ncbi:MAG: bifunctional metallophosphatase/5'-nucleotidase [Bacteroidetes bacterium]|nr:bifunctional metallophosphatase/5'-nucleotidase [Bacteroidota bacterium]
MRYILILLLLAVPATAQETVDLTILHYNDFHAQNTPTTLSVRTENGKSERVPVGGSAVLKAMIERERATVPNPLLLHAGDDFQGTPISSITKGRSQFELLELMQPDVMTLGNHEFDYGTENLRTLLPTVTFPIVSANLWDKSRGAPFVPRYRILHRDGLAIGVIGLAPPDLSTLTLRENVRDLDVLPPAMAVRNTMNELERNHGIRFVIVLSHMGFDQDSLLAEAVEGIDVIVGGHSHSALFVPKRVNGSVIVQAGSSGRWLGRLALTVDAGKGTVLNSFGELLPTRVDGVTPDPVVAARVAALEAVVDSGFGEVIGELVHDWKRSSGAESNVGNWMTDVMRDFAKADVAFQNSGGIRKDLPAGPITLRDIWEVSPFGNEFVTFTVTGAELLGMIRYQALVTGEFCQVSGLRYTYDYTVPEEDALRAEINGMPVDPVKTYSVATNNYVGGHLHDVFGLPEKEVTVQPVYPAHVDRDVLIEYVRKQQRIDSRIEARITLIGERK